MRDGLSADGTLYARTVLPVNRPSVMYRKDLTAAGVTIADNDSWEKYPLWLPLRCTTRK
jgi:hypothetical protein